MNVDFNNTKAQEIFKDFSSSKTVGYIRQNSDNN